MRRILACFFALATALGAQDLEPASLGIQGRLSLPEGREARLSMVRAGVRQLPDSRL